jgi:hypothetical protein
MTLNVLRDPDGNMMSLIKYWNRKESGGDNPPAPDLKQTILDKLYLNYAHLG